MEKKEKHTTRHKTENKNGSSIGKAIFHYRKKYRLSQNLICEGICSTVTLSRMEEGKREYDLYLSHQLLSRIGKTENRFEFVLEEEDYRLQCLRKEIQQSIKERRIKKTEELLHTYKGNMPQNQKLHQQFVQFYDAMLGKLKKEPKDTILEELKQALLLTRPDYKEKKYKLFSSMEVKIIYELFLYEACSEYLIYSLMNFMDDYYDTEEKNKYMIPFYNELVKKYEKENRQNDRIKAADQAIGIIGQGRNYQYLADFYFHKIKAEEIYFRSFGQWEKKRKELIEICHHLYYLYMMEEETEKMEQAETFCREKLQCQITI